MNGKIFFINRGKCGYNIVIGRNPTPACLKAADELALYIEKICGSSRPEIIKSDEKIEGKTVYLGPHPIVKEYTKKYGADPDEIDRILNPPSVTSVYADTFIHIIEGDIIILGGSGYRASLYAVYDFLEKFIGIVFADPEFTYIPSVENIELPDRYFRINRPAFRFRMVTYLRELDPEFSVKMKCNMNPFAEEEWGGDIKISIGRMTHTFYNLVNPDKYYDTHPEYFASVNGKRRRALGQLCLSNLEVQKIAADTVIEWFREEPDVFTMGVVQNDIDGYCECPKCKEIERKHGGVHSAPIILFCNKIAERIREEFPDKEKYIHTIAYTYSLKPPENIELNERLIVIVCDMFPDCADHKPLGEDPHTVNYLEYVKKWRKLAGTLAVWHYCVDFIHFLMPFPNFRSLYADTKIYREIGVDGIFFQATTAPGVLGEFEELRNWFLYHILWDPDSDFDGLINTFMDAYYGEAAPQIKELFYELHNRIESDGVFMHLYSGLEAGYLDPQFVKEWQSRLAECIEKMKDGPYKDHVEKILLSLDYTYLIFPVKMEVRLGEIFVSDIEYRKKVFERLERLSRKFGVYSFGEGIPGTDFLERQRILCKKWPITGLAIFAPIVYGVLKDMLEAVIRNTDNKDNFRPDRFIHRAIRRGFNPITLNHWMNEQNIGMWTDDDVIWVKKLNRKAVERILNPLLPNINPSDLPNPVVKLIKDLPEQEFPLLFGEKEGEIEKKSQ